MICFIHYFELITEISQIISESIYKSSYLLLLWRFFLRYKYINVNYKYTLDNNVHIKLVKLLPIYGCHNYATIYLFFWIFVEQRNLNSYLFYEICAKIFWNTYTYMRVMWWENKLRLTYDNLYKLNIHNYILYNKRQCEYIQEMAVNLFTEW